MFPEVLLMRIKKLRAIAIALLGLVLMLPGLPFPDMSSGGAEAAGESAIIPDEIPVWADGFDDNSKVYIPPGGLVGVEVLGSAVQLLPGSTGGWVASEVITCPEDYRYDLVIL